MTGAIELGRTIGRRDRLGFVSSGAIEDDRPAARHTWRRADPAQRPFRSNLRPARARRAHQDSEVTAFCRARTMSAVDVAPGS